MSFADTLEKIESSDLFKNFKEQYPGAELVAGFFILDFLSNDTKQTLDYKTDSKVFTFTLHDNDNITVKEDKLMDEKQKLSEIKPEVGIEVEELKGIAGFEALEHGISAKFHKIIAILQIHDGKQVWNLTCMLEGLIILNILIDSSSGEIIKFERKSMMDMIRKK